MKEKKEQIIKWLKSIKKENMLSIVIICGVIILVIIFIYLNWSKTYDSYKVLDVYERTDSNTKEYLNYDKDKIVRYSNDGITVMDKNANLLWTSSYEMNNPKVVIEDTYIAVADIGGTEINLYNETGELHSIKNNLEIEKVDVSEQGLVAMLVNDGMASYIKIADSSKEYIEIKTRIREDGYVMDFAFSPDSKKLVTSSMRVEGTGIKNDVTCYNLGEIGKSYESKIVAGYSYEDKIVPDIEFVDSTTFVVFAEDSFDVYTMKEIPENRSKSEKFEHNIESVFYTDKYIGVILDNNDKFLKEVKVYNLDGKLKFEKEISYEYSNVYMDNNDIIMYSANDALIYEVSGNVKFEGKFDENVEYILPNNKKKFYLVTAENIQKVKLSKGD